MARKSSNGRRTMSRAKKSAGKAKRAVKRTVKKTTRRARPGSKSTKTKKTTTRRR